MIKIEGLILPSLKVYCKAVVIKGLWYWDKDSHTDQWIELRIQTQTLTFMFNWFLISVPKTIQWGKIIPLTDGARKSEYPCAKKFKLPLTSHHTQKLTENGS